MNHWQRFSRFFEIFKGQNLLGKASTEKVVSVPLIFVNCFDGFSFESDKELFETFSEILNRAVLK